MPTMQAHHNGKVTKHDLLHLSNTIVKPYMQIRCARYLGAPGGARTRVYSSVTAQPQNQLWGHYTRELVVDNRVYIPQVHASMHARCHALTRQPIHMRGAGGRGNGEESVAASLVQGGRRHDGSEQPRGVPSRCQAGHSQAHGGLRQDTRHERDQAGAAVQAGPGCARQARVVPILPPEALS